MSAAKRLYDRAIEMIGLGRGTTAADGGTPIQKVQVIFTTTGGLRGALEFMQHYGFASRPHEGCDYAVFSLSGDPTKGFITASNDQRYRLPLQEGESGIHDDQGQFFLIGRDVMTAKHKSGSIFSMNSDGSITLAPANGIVNVIGQIAGTGHAGVGMAMTGSVTATGDVIAGVGGADQVSLQNHTQQNGGGTGPSGPPTPGT